MEEKDLLSDQVGIPSTSCVREKRQQPQVEHGVAHVFENKVWLAACTLEKDKQRMVDSSAG